MKANPRKITTGLLVCAALFAASNITAADDLDVCKGGYKVLLMTPGECRGYLRELRAVQAKSDHMAVIELQEWHTQLLIERSQACPCDLKPASMRSARMVSNSQSQPAYSIRY